jgi:hypothetical protein
MLSEAKHLVCIDNFEILRSLRSLRMTGLQEVIFLILHY